MSGDIFLKLDGIQGESADNKHKGEIDVESFHWGVSQPHSLGGGGGGGTGKATFNDLNVSTHVHKHSAGLQAACEGGKHIAKGVLVVRKAGEKPQEYLKITLTDVLVSSYNLSDHAGGNELPSESFSLGYSKIEFEYSPQKADGTLDAATKSGWDVKANVKL